MNNKFNPEHLMDSGMDSFESVFKKFKLDPEMIKRDNIIAKTNEDGTYDRSGCDYIFIRSFATPPMVGDFSLIARDFLKHEAANLDKYKNKTFLGCAPTYSETPDFWISGILLFVLNGARAGSCYCKNLLRYLFKTYHKTLYKTFKKFKEISSEEAALLSMENDVIYFDKLSIVLCMTEVFDVKQKSDCKYLYYILEEERQNREEKEDAVFDVPEPPETLMQECAREIIDRFGTDIYHITNKYEEFTRECVKQAGFQENFIRDKRDFVDGNYIGLSEALRLMKWMYPNQTVSTDELLLLAQIYETVDAATMIADNIDRWWDTFLGMSDERIREMGLFDPSKIESSTSQLEPTEKLNGDSRVKDEQLEDEVEVLHQTQTEMQAEIESLRASLRIAEKDKKTLYHELQKTKREVDVYRTLEREISDYRGELSALRSHLYHFTEYDEPAEASSIDSMIEDLKKKRITIVGGHINWVNKLKRIFPKWNYVTPSVSASNNPKWASGADFVYFFTDTISHTVYNKFISIVREDKIAFGYIHGVSIEANVKQMWKEVCKTE